MSNATTIDDAIQKQINVLSSIKDAINTFIIPAVCLFGLLTNLLNIYIFLNRKRFKASLYKYLLINSTLEFLYLTITLVYYVFKLVYASRLNEHYWLKLYEYYLLNLFTLFLAFLIIQIEIAASLKRLFIIVNFNLTLKCKFIYVLSAFIAFSFLNTFTLFVCFDVQPKSRFNSTIYVTSVTRLGHAGFLTFSTYSLFALRGLLGPIILAVISVLIIVQLKKRLIIRDQLKNRASVPSEHDEARCMLRQDRLRSAKNNLGKMLIIINFMIGISNLTHSITHLLYVKVGTTTRIFHVSSLISHPLLYLSHSSSIVFYFNYDKTFNRELRKIFSFKSDSNSHAIKSNSNKAS